MRCWNFNFEGLFQVDKVRERLRAYLNIAYGSICNKIIVGQSNWQGLMIILILSTDVLAKILHSYGKNKIYNFENCIHLLFLLKK